MRRIRPAIMAALTLIVAWASCRAPRERATPFTVGMEDEVLTLDPHLEDESVTHSVLSNIYDPLVMFDDQMRIVPALAQTWENPDELTWRFNLRPGVLFHDGRPLTSDDVKYSLERARGTGVGYYLATVKQVRVVNDLTVEIITSRASPVLLNKLTFIAIVPQGYQQLESSPNGTGAYRFVSYQRGQSLTLRANDKYWGGPPAIYDAIIRFIPQRQQRAAELIAGRLSLTRDITEDDLKKAGNDAGITITRSPSLMVGYLGVNFKIRSPLTSRMVREAIFWALDPRELLAETKLDAMPSDQFVSPYIVGFLPPEKSSGRPDLGKSRQLLREAGYPRGFPLTLDVTTAALTKSGPVIVRQLGRVGIKVKLRGFSWPVLSERLNRRQCQFFMVGWGCSSGDASDLFDACLHTPTSADFGKANWGGYSNRQLDALIEASDQTLDNQQRIGLLHAAMELAMMDKPLIPLYAKNSTYAARSDITFTPRQDGRIKIAEIVLP